jgi:tetratricopeptide (TPR) repeat protein
MNRSHATPATRRFHLVQGCGSPERGEAEQLNRFLAGPDPVLIASLQQEERNLRRQRLRWGLAALLALTVAIPALWLAPLLHQPAALAGRMSPDLEEAWRRIGEARQELSENRLNEALENATSVIRIAPGLADAWVLLGDCQMKDYQSALSEKAFSKALALEPRSPGALLGLGALYLRRGEERKAEEVWKRGGLDRKLAGLYLLQGRFDEAESRLKPLLAESPNDGLLSQMAAAASARNLDPGLRSLLEPEPTGRSAWADLGWRLSRKERHEEAAGAFSEAVARVPNDVNALSGLGWSLLALNRTEEAKTYFERALKLDYDHALSLNGLAHCLKNEGRTGEAIAVWQGMAELYPGVNYGTPGLAWTYYELRDYRQAAVYFARLVKRDPYDSRVIDALNVAVENLGPVVSR